MQASGQAWADLGPDLRQRLQRAIGNLFENFGKRRNEVLLLTWCRALAPYAKGDMIWQQLEAACLERSMPAPVDLIKAMGGRPETEAFKPIPELSPEQRRRSDHAAVLSMLWLHYEKGWSVADISGHVLARMFPGDIVKAVEAAKEIYTPEAVRSWMYDQEQAGN